MAFCSTIIPTIARPTLARAVESVLAQVLDQDSFEVIIVNDSGEPLPSAAWQSSPLVRVIDTHQRERAVARNTGAAVARGRYLHFLDDDDWLLPGALASLYRAAEASRVDWIYGVSQLVDRQDQPLLQLRHELGGNAFVQVMAGEWVPLQASLINAHAFFRVGGFSPTLSGPEDVDLCRRIALHGELASTPDVVVCIEMGRAGSSTDYERHAVHSRRAREKILDESGVLARLAGSATDADWHGRIVRAYLTSAVWNAQHRRGWTVASRLLMSAAAMLLAGRHLRARGFWSAVTHSYASPTFSRGFEAAGAAVLRSVGSQAPTVAS